MKFLFHLGILLCLVALVSAGWNYKRRSKKHSKKHSKEASREVSKEVSKEGSKNECAKGRKLRIQGKRLCICTGGKFHCRTAKGKPCESGGKKYKHGLLVRKGRTTCMCLDQDWKCIKKRGVKAAIDAFCTENKLKAIRGRMCMCHNGKWRCTNGKGGSCKVGDETIKDGLFINKDGIFCFCTDTVKRCTKANPKYLKSRLKVDAETGICTEQKLQKDRDNKCMCKNGVWRCTKGKGEQCDMGGLKVKDGDFKVKDGVFCFCTNGKRNCAKARYRFSGKGMSRRLPKLPKIPKILLRVKRQRDTCKFGPHVLIHGGVFQFGVNCKCRNGKLKCSKYSGFADNKHVSQSMTERDTQEAFPTPLRLSRDVTKTSKGNSCTFVKAGLRVTRQHGERLSYGLRCTCTDGKLTCINRRV